MQPAIRLMVLPLVMLAAARAAAADPDIPELAWTPRSDWIDVTRDVSPAAKGDGATDDSAAIQAALSRLGDDAGQAKTVYLPAGTYRITRTLQIPLLHGLLLVGDGRTTRLVYDGPADANVAMLRDDGAVMARYEGFVLEGAGKAGVGIDHAAYTADYVTESDHYHLAFHDLPTAGIRVGYLQQQASSEMIYCDCLVTDCGRGFWFLTFNDYDNVVTGCEFLRNDIGVEIHNGANGYIRDSHFAGSRIADIVGISPEHPCSVRRCSSIGSNAFLNWDGGVATLAVQDCRIGGWGDPAAAMSLAGSPATVLDCVFSEPPATAQPPILFSTQVIGSGNAVVGGGSPYHQASGGALTVVPLGQRGPSLASPSQGFLRASVAVPPVVFDAKRDFGATGDGSADDTAAIQAAIDAARRYGQGALAYLPVGTYRTTRTLEVAGSDYVVGGGGSGYSTHIAYDGATPAPTMHVGDPTRIRVERLMLAGPADQEAPDLLQDGTQPGSIAYESLWLWGMYQQQPFHRGLQLVGLPAGMTVTLRHTEGNLRSRDSSRARILGDAIWEGGVVVEGANERQRDGFFGLLTRFFTNEPFGLYVRDDQDAVITDFYTEQSGGYWSIQGADGDPTGHVTIVGLKVNCDQSPAIAIDDYAGRVTGLGLQFYVGADPQTIAHAGTQPVDLTFAGCTTYSPALAVAESGSGATWSFIADLWRAPGPADGAAATAIAKLVPAFDDLRQLGALDLELFQASDASSPIETPYGGTARAIPGTIEAEDFDEGGEGVAYHDDDPANDGGAYRATAVDVYADANAGNGAAVGWIAPGEWLRYTVNVVAAGTYALSARVGLPGGGGTFHVECDGADVSGAMSVPDTGGWVSYATISASASLPAGTHVLRVVFDGAGASGVCNLDRLTFTAASGNIGSGSGTTTGGTTSGTTAGGTTSGGTSSAGGIGGGTGSVANGGQGHRGCGQGGGLAIAVGVFLAIAARRARGG